MFIGEYQNSIDDKGRVIIPAKFREELGFRFILTKGLDRCLVIYSMEEWERFMQKLATLPKASKDARAFIRFLTGAAVECELDKQGRLVIPQALRAYAQIEKDLITTGNMDNVEIWSREVLEQYRTDNLCDDEIAAKMAELGI